MGGAGVLRQMERRAAKKKMSGLFVQQVIGLDPSTPWMTGLLDHEHIPDDFESPVKDKAYRAVDRGLFQFDGDR